MKLGLLAACALAGVLSITSGAFAQSNDSSLVMSRSARTIPNSDPAGRVAVVDQVPTLEGARPAAGMLPHQPTGPVKDVTGAASRGPVTGADLRPSQLRP